MAALCGSSAGRVAGDLVNDVRYYSEADGRFVSVTSGTPPPASDKHRVVSFAGSMWFFDSAQGGVDFRRWGGLDAEERDDADDG